MTARQSKPPYDWTSLRGLLTKNNPDLIEPEYVLQSKNTDYFSEYGSVRKIRGNKRVLSEIYKEAAVAKPISWVGFYKHNDFAGQIHRDILIAAGTTYQRVNSDGSLTELYTGQPNGLFRDHAQFGRYLLITSQNPYKTGERGDFVKYDGFKMMRWGVEAPGRQETIIEDMSSLAGFNANGCTLTSDSDIAWDDSAAKVTMAVGVSSAYFEKSYSSFAIENTIADRSELKLYIPESQYRKLATTGRCLSVYFSSSGGIDNGADEWVRYDFRIGQVAAGWNTLNFDFTVFPSGNLGTSQNASTFDDQALNFVRYEILVQTPAASLSESFVSYWDHLTSLDAGAPLPTGTSPNLDGIFQAGDGQIWSYKVTFENEHGVESNAGPESVEWDLSAEDGIAEDTVREDFEDHNNFSTNSTNSLSTDSTNFSENSASVSLNKSITSSVNGDIKRTGLSLDFGNIINDTFKIDLYIPTGSRSNLASTAVEIYLADSSNLDNYLKFNVPSGNLVEGEFSTHTFDTNLPDQQAGAFDLSAVDTILIRFITTSAATTQNNLKVDNLRVDAPSSFDEITLTDLPISEDPGVVKRNIYRTVANGTAWLFLASINDNTTTSYVDTISDGALGSGEPPQAGRFFDSSLPPTGAMIKVWKRTVFMAGDPQNPNLLYFSQDDDPDLWPLINAFEFDDPITGIYETRLGLVVTTENDHYRVIGDNPDYFVDRVLKGMGNVGFRACNEARMFGWAHDRDGIRLYDLTDTNKITEPIRDKIDQLNKDNLKDAWTIHSKRLNKIITFYKNAAGVYDTSYYYQYPIDNVREGWWSELEFPASLEFLSGEEVEDENADFHLYVGGNDGMLYELFAEDTDNWILADGQEEAITMTLESIPLRFGPLAAEFSGVTGRWKPHTTELRTREASGKVNNWTLNIKTKDGSGKNQKIRDQYDQSFTFPANMTLQRYADQYRELIPAEYVTFLLTNSDQDVDVYFQGLRCTIEAYAGNYVVEGEGPGGRS